MRTQVVICGAGPAGTLLSQLLALEGIESIILEIRSREHVLSRIRAGVLEQSSVEILDKAAIGVRLEREGFVHKGVNLAFAGSMFRVDFAELIGRSVTIYGQTEVQKDLYAACDQRNQQMVFEAGDIQLREIDSASPSVAFEYNGDSERIDCDFLVGCDGAHGTSRRYISDSQTYQREYPFGWLGILSETPPVNDELIYNHHERGFALCSMRNPRLSRYYLQCPLDTVVDEWPDDRFWEELKARLPKTVSRQLVTGDSIEKAITPLRSFVSSPMSFGRLFLAGDAAHLVPPTGAKGLNLAISDVAYLAQALTDFYRTGSNSQLGTYSETALKRVWKAVRFSWWMTTLLHRFEENGSFGQKLQEAELDYLAGSRAAQTAMAENYAGLPLL